MIRSKKWPDVMLLGEVHDNPAGHKERFQTLKKLLSEGWRPAIAMEQFDREVQPALKNAARTCKNADCLLAAVTKSPRWDWSLYKPVIDLALHYRLPILAANVSREDAAKVVHGGLAAVLDKQIIQNAGLGSKTDLMKGQEKEIIEGHCGKLPKEMVGGMVNAQVARDIWMAKVLRENHRQGVVLLAGNGHVRKDLGVPNWLTDLKVRSIGFIEKPVKRGVYDRSVIVPPHPRPDPCAQFTMPGKSE